MTVEEIFDGRETVSKSSVLKMNGKMEKMYASQAFLKIENLKQYY